MSLDHILLGYLREPASGYDLGREFSEGAAHFWFAERSQIYPALKKLEAKGWLRSWEAPSERGPARRVYETTRQGREQLRAWLVGGPQIGRDRLGYIAQTFFLGDLDDLDASLGVVQSMRARWRETLATFERFESEALDAAGSIDNFPDSEFHHYAALRMGLHQIRAKLAWCDETIQRLQARISEPVPASQEH